MAQNLEESRGMLTSLGLELSQSRRLEVREDAFQVRTAVFTFLTLPKKRNC